MFATVLWLVCLASVVTITGCKKDPAEIPESDRTLAGIDADHNGMRDDVEAKLKKDYASKVTREEMLVIEQNSKAFQEILSTDLKDRTAVLLAREHLDWAMNCGVLVFGDDLRYHDFTILLTELKKMYFNTKMRKEFQLDFIYAAREYHYERISFQDVNTCEFEFSDAFKEELKRRAEFKKMQAERKAQQEAKKE